MSIEPKSSAKEEFLVFGTIKCVDCDEKIELPEFRIDTNKGYKFICKHCRNKIIYRDCIIKAGYYCPVNFNNVLVLGRNPCDDCDDMFLKERK